MKDRINLIYIASTGRSGSTLLDMLLGSHPQIATAGEIQILPHEILLNDFMPCGCGKPISECLFWQEIIEDINILSHPEPQINYFREEHNRGKTVRWKHLFELFSRRLHESKQAEIDIYGLNNYDLFHKFLDVHEKDSGVRPKWIIDASKDPYRLLWLKSSDLFDIKVIHLVKDPRAFAYSMNRKVLDQPDYTYKAYRLTLRKTLSWLLHNYFFSKIQKKYFAKSDFLLVNYENLASRPQETYNNILEFIDSDLKRNAIEEYKEKTFHTIAGNNMRYRPRQIILDEKWKTSLPFLHKKTVELLSYFAKSNYGY